MTEDRYHRYHLDRTGFHPVTRTVMKRERPLQNRYCIRKIEKSLSFSLYAGLLRETREWMDMLPVRSWTGKPVSSWTFAAA